MSPSLRRPSARASWLLDSLVLFGLAAILIAPLWTVVYLNNWASIESTFIADARFLVEHWPHPLWQPLWYGGTRFDYVYPPALRYGTAILSILLGVPPARAYHLYTAGFYCLGIAGVYLFVRVASGARLMAWLAATATALLPPAVLFIKDLREDIWSAYLNPTRLHVLIKYGEGPHILALCLVPFALAASHQALTAGSARAIALAAFSSALVVAHNFYGAVNLVILFPILAWSLWTTHRDHTMWPRAVAIAALSYGLDAFWLTPSYLRVTRANLALVEAAGKPAHLAAGILALLAFAAVAYRLGRGHRERAYPIFVGGALLAFASIVLGYWRGLRIVGSGWRLTPELDLALILTGLGALRWLWRRFPAPVPRFTIVLAIAVPLLYWHDYPTRAWRLFPKDPHPERRIQYRLSEWIAQNLPGSRTYVTGSLRFWYDAWRDLAHLGGGSDQGVINHATLPAMLEVAAGESGQLAIQWLLCFGVDAVVVHDQTSEEVYHDYAFPKKFAGRLPVLYDNGRGDVIYKVPRRFAGLARVVDKSRAESLQPVRDAGDIDNLRAYVDVIERGPDSPAVATWEGTDSMRIRARVEAGQVLLLLVAHDPAWHAESAGRAVPIRKDLLGQMILDAPPGEHDIRLVFALPRENLYGRIASAAAAMILLVLFLRP